MLLNLILLCTYSRQLTPYVTPPPQFWHHTVTIFSHCHTRYSRHKTSKKGNRSSPKEPDLPVTGVQDGEPRVTSRWQLHYRRCGHAGMVVVWRTEQRPQQAVGLHCSRVSAQLTVSQSFAQYTAHSLSLGTLSSNTYSPRSGIWAHHTQQPYVWLSNAHTACFLRCYRT